MKYYFIKCLNEKILFTTFTRIQISKVENWKQEIQILKLNIFRKCHSLFSILLGWYNMNADERSNV